MSKLENKWTPCLHCTKGVKGNKTCSAGHNARTLKVGCFNGIRK